MEARNKNLLRLASLLLIPIFLFPIWRISLNAPQYPEGIGLKIWVNTIEGQKPQDLKNINGLNHYIGMQAIEPDSIPELKIMPPLFIFLIISGLFIAQWGNRNWLLAWLISFVALAVVGLVDFYLWEYDYGHNLSLDAPIKVPGMSYQPPLIGTKQLLNMRTTSMPSWGFLFAVLSMAVAAWAWFRDFQSGRKNALQKSASEVNHSSSTKSRRSFALAGLFFFGLTACSQDPQPVHLGSDECAYCKMIIADAKFPTQLVNETGKSFRFDSIECMRSFVKANPDRAESAKLYVTNFGNPGTWIEAQKAFFVISEVISSPMGAYLLAFASAGERTKHLAQYEGQAIDWAGLVSDSTSGVYKKMRH